ncbi:hypothetical protein [Bacillus rhizoplanae]|uniref:hypothetical protein n=1 Tax=Bacillus rhizoplanae TaxID=2880966 RepID=UPI003D26056D
MKTATSRLNKEDVKEMLKGFYENGYGTWELSWGYQVSQRQVQKIVKGQAWRSIFVAYVEEQMAKSNYTALDKLVSKGILKKNN